MYSRADSRWRVGAVRHGACRAEISSAWNDRRVSLENVLRVDADGRGHATLCSIEPDGRPVREVVPVQRLGDYSIKVAGSPGLVMGCAAGDVLRLEADGQFTVEQRGPYECVQAYADPPFSQEAIDSLAEAFQGSGGFVEAPAHRTFLVLTVPTAVGRAIIAERLSAWGSQLGPMEWQFGTRGNDEA